MERLQEIKENWKNKENSFAECEEDKELPGFISDEDVNWLIQEVERLNKMLESVMQKEKIKWMTFYEENSNK